MKPSSFDQAQIEHLARLAALSLSPEESARMATELAAIVAYVEELASVDTSAVPARSPSAPAAWREDVVTTGLSREEALRGAPHATDVGFAVPGFVGAGSAVRGG